MSSVHNNQSPQFFILAGHGGKDPGAIANGVQESALTFEQQGLITNALRSLGAKVLNEPKTASFQKTIAFVKTLCQPEDVLVDLHFNAATPTASGAEVYYRQRYAPKEI
ncbi:MAG: N-acetylmuramoyl-L-alanine amidase, partial [Bacteroidota bacterium]